MNIIRSHSAMKRLVDFSKQSFRHLQRTHFKVDTKHCPYSLNLCIITPVCKKAIGYTLVSCIFIRQVTKQAYCNQVQCHGNHFKNLKLLERAHQHDSSKDNKLVQIIGSVNRYIRLLLHLTWLCCLYCPLFAAYPITIYIPSWREPWLKALLVLVEISGPTFIKLGQWASTRRDLFSVDFCDTFSKLHMNAPSHSWQYTERRLAEVFGKDWREIFVVVDSAIHSGCIGQVHKAYMRSDVVAKVRSQVNIGGQFRIPAAEIQEFGDPSNKTPLIPVAIKILHPGVYSTVHWDIQVLHTMATLCAMIPGVKWISLPESVTEFEMLMKNQIDLIVEAENLDQFNKNFSGVSSVKFPRPIWPFVTHDILVETYEEGESISTFIQMREGPDGLKERLAEIGINVLLKMVFVDNFVHADLHPGNILVQGVADYKPITSNDRDDIGFDASEISMGRQACPLRLVLLDTGIVGHLSEEDRKNLHQVFLAVALGKGDVAAELMVNHARSSECNDIEHFKSDMAVLVQQAHRVTLQLGQMQVGPLIQDLLNLFIRHKVKFESNFASVLLAVMVLEGLGRSLDPRVDILEAAIPVLLGKSV